MCGDWGCGFPGPTVRSWPGISKLQTIGQKSLDVTHPFALICKTAEVHQTEEPGRTASSVGTSPCRVFICRMQNSHGTDWSNDQGLCCLLEWSKGILKLGAFLIWLFYISWSNAPGIGAQGWLVCFKCCLTDSALQSWERMLWILECVRMGTEESKAMEGNTENDRRAGLHLAFGMFLKSYVLFCQWLGM